MKGLISFLKLWTAVLLNAVMPVRENQMKVTAFAGGTYQAADAYQAGQLYDRTQPGCLQKSGEKGKSRTNSLHGNLNKVKSHS